MDSMKLQNILPCIDRKEEAKTGKTATIRIVNLNGRRYAFKQYKSDDPAYAENPAVLEHNILKLFNGVNKDRYQEMTSFIGAFPKVLVYDKGVFCGYLMDPLPRSCYTWDNKGRNLDKFWGVRGEVREYSDIRLGQFVKHLILAIGQLHDEGYILGDMLSGKNLYVRIEGGVLYPYFIDTDSARTSASNPTGVYHSPDYIPPEGEDAPSSKESDIYKFCIIVLRLFAEPEKDYERAGLLPEDPAAAASKLRIQKTLGTEFLELLSLGFFEVPAFRPTVGELFRSLQPNRRHNHQ